MTMQCGAVRLRHSRLLAPRTFVKTKAPAMEKLLETTQLQHVAIYSSPSHAVRRCLQCTEEPPMYTCYTQCTIKQPKRTQDEHQSACCKRNNNLFMGWYLTTCAWGLCVHIPQPYMPRWYMLDFKLFTATTAAITAVLQTAADEALQGSYSRCCSRRADGQSAQLVLH